MFAGHSWTNAMNNARALATWSGKPRYVFMDTSGNIRIEKTQPMHIAGGVTTVMPEPEKDLVGPTDRKEQENQDANGIAD